MSRFLPFSPLLAALLIAGCATPPAPPPATPGVVNVPDEASPQLAFKLASGVYRCEYGVRVEVQRDARDPNLLQLSWNGGTYRMVRNPSSSGLPRYEETGGRLVWIDLPWKSVLLDEKSGKPLVSECRSGAPA